jgi:hypothetical protein
MKKIFIVIAISLFVVGVFLFLGSYFIFNRYSISDSHLFPGYAWQLPQIPLELHEGDKIEIKISQTGSLDGNISMVNSTGQKRTLLSSSFGNGTVYYYVQTSDFYRFFVEVDSWGSNPPYVLTLDITVVDKDPNLLFQVLGGIVLLAGAVIAFRYRRT